MKWVEVRGKYTSVWHLRINTITFATANYSSTTSQKEPLKYVSQIYVGLNSIPARKFASIEEAKDAAEKQLRALFRVLGLRLS